MRKIAHPICLDGALDRLLGHTRHHQQPFFQIVEFLLKANPQIIQTCP